MLVARAAELAPRAAWTRAELQAHQTAALRQVVARAQERSPFWRDRLAHLDAATVTPSDLASVPPVTKDDLMEHWDAISAVDGLTLAAAGAAIERAAGEAVAGCTVMASSGTGGCVAVMAHTPGTSLDFLAANLRERLLRSMAGGPAPRIPAGPTVVLSSGSRRHGSATSVPDAVLIGTDVPLDEAVRTLDELRPALVTGLTSRLAEIALAQRDGRLSISPALVVAVGEPVDDEVARLLVDAFPDSDLDQIYGITEVYSIAGGLLGGSIPVHEDLLFVEAVDRDNRPASAGEPSARLLCTPLVPTALPLFRYMVDDMVSLDRVPETGFQRIRAVVGRSDDHFRYGGIDVHPSIFRAALTHPGVLGYQVTQLPRGASIAVVATADVDLEAVAAEVRRALQHLGLDDPEVSVQRVERLPRTPSGKVRRFVPVAAGASI
jgi:phenylacetate-coenzyme A ligase PaaK-like adenylate-forming protein